MRRDFLKELKKRPLVFDGATGTMLQRLGLKPGGCPDELVLKEPSMVARVHAAYMKAGSDVVTTNTFGANRMKLREYGLEHRLCEINMEAARIAKDACPGLFVAGGMGPTGRFVEPVGELSFDEALDVFAGQARALKQGGAHLIIIETMMDIKEMRAAIIGAKATGLPVVATMTFDETLRTVLGTPPEVFAVIAASLGADVIGANCSLGIEGILRAVSGMQEASGLPLIAQPNAGIPVIKDNETVFPASPDEMSAYVPRLAKAGVRVLGGCCGTTPEHIKKMGAAFRRTKPSACKGSNMPTALASRSSVTLFGAGLAPIVIGERINPTGRKKLAEEIREGRTSMIRQEARAQEAAFAKALDVNVGVPGIDEPLAMKRAVFSVNENSSLPVVIDSSSPEAVLAGLKAVDGKPLINSVSGERKKLDAILPLAKEYGAAVLGLTLDDKGIPATARGRLRVAERILKAALSMGMRKEDVVIDCLALTVSAEPQSALTTLEAIGLIKKELGLSTMLGVSNISFGLPARNGLNSSFLAMALRAGLDSAIINPHVKEVMDSYLSSLVLLAKDPSARNYIARQGASAPVEKPTTIEPAPQDIKARLSRAIVEGDEEGVTALVEEAMRQGLGPMEISNLALIPGLDEVGRLFASNRYYLPQVMLSADAMKKAFERLKKEFSAHREASLGTVVMATVEGDIHDIGKNIVTTLLENHGFDVVDLGKNVPAERIVRAAREKKADVVGLSALMTTTVMEMESVIKRLEREKVAVRTIVGGAVVTPEFAVKIGAEYGGDAVSAVDRIKKMVKR